MSIPERSASDTITLHNSAYFRPTSHNQPTLSRRALITSKTVEQHLTNVYEKLGVRSRPEAILWIQEYMPRLLE
jgi:hypothetical protein